MSREGWIVLGVIGAVVAVVTLVWAIRLMLRLVAVRRALVAVGGRKGTAVFWAALAYTIFPIDILPDPIYLDDVTVLGAALWFLTRLLRRQTSLPRVQAAASRLVGPAGRPGRPR